MLPEALNALQDSLRESLAKDGLSNALSTLKKALPEQTEKYNLVFQLETRLNRINKDRIKGILSQEQLEIAYNRLSDDILSLINNLGVEDFEIPSASAAQTGKKSGAVLYQIPRKMELDPEKTYRCIVRLAFNEEVIVENLDLNKDTVLKPVRVSEIMEVELKDPNDAPAFTIQLINSAEQFLEENAYTEWQFKVKPIRTGELPLLLVVAVKEYIRNRPVKREIVLEEIIHVVAEPVENVEDTAEFQSAGYTFLYSSAPENRGAGALVTTVFQGKYNMVASVLLIFMIAAGIWAIGSRFGWFKAKSKVIEIPGEINKNNSTRDQINNKDTAGETSLRPADTAALINIQGTADSVNKSTSPRKMLGPQKNPRQNPLDKLKTPTKKGLQAPHEKPKVALEPIQKPDPSKIRKSGFTMVKVEGGALLLGRHYEAKACPVEEVQLRSFNIGKYEITQADWMEIMGKNPAFNRGCSDCPVENVSWNDVQAFVQKASIARKKKYRLPFEAEWEYAARGGQNLQDYLYAGSKRPTEVAWFNTINDFTHKVGLKKPNSLDIYDLSGNVREWSQGIFPPYLNCKPEDAEKMALRGGSWANQKGRIRIVDRVSKSIKYRDKQSGLRMVEER